MVVLHFKKSDLNQFLVEISAKTPVEEVRRVLVASKSTFEGLTLFSQQLETQSR
jgi:hypothetical protein